MKLLRYAEIEQKLKDYAQQAPDLISVSSIGQSFEGREIFVVTITSKATGLAEDKPAILIDGNIHAVEMTASAAALYFIEFLIENFGKDERVTRCLESRAFYVIPRVNPDGAELALAERPRFVRSGSRPYFYADDDRARLVAQDIDGDGRLLNMRVADPNGRWKCSPDDTRVMVQREPTETGGTYFRLLPEGRIENQENGEIPAVYPVEGVDFNRNWPSNWAGEGVQRGAGRFPLSEPETYALAAFISDHPNISSWIAGHTFSGVLLRPGFTKADHELPFTDLTHYERVGNRGTELSGYPAVSAFTGFRINHGEAIHGSVEWGYDNFGIYTWIIEYWAPHTSAGIRIENFAKWFFDHPGEDDVRMVDWGEKELGAGTFVDWYAFDHPQLGKVELGGWDLIRTLYNPPEAKIEETIKPFPEWFLWQAEMTPRLAFRETDKQLIGDDVWQVSAVIENIGYLPTYCSAQAMKTRAYRALEATLDGDGSIEFLGGARRLELGELAGRAFKTSSALTAFIADETDDRVRVVWTIRAPAGCKVTITAKHDRAGKIATEIEL